MLPRKKCFQEKDFVMFENHYRDFLEIKKFLDSFWAKTNDKASFKVHIIVAFSLLLVLHKFKAYEKFIIHHHHHHHHHVD
jgi:hypothetical protein